MLCRHIAAGAIRAIAANGAGAAQINLPLFTSHSSMKLIIVNDTRHGHKYNDILNSFVLSRTILLCIRYNVLRIYIGYQR